MNIYLVVIDEIKVSAERLHDDNSLEQENVNEALTVLRYLREKFCGEQEAEN